MRWKSQFDLFYKRIKKPRHLKNIVKLDLAYVLGIMFVLIRPINSYLFSDIRYLVMLLPCIVVNAPNTSAGANFISTVLILIMGITVTYTAYAIIFVFSPISDGLVLFGYACVAFTLGSLRALAPRYLSAPVTVASFLFISEIANGHFDYEAGTLSSFRATEYVKVAFFNNLDLCFGMPHQFWRQFNCFSLLGRRLRQTTF